jgi:hypothetical protein
MNEPMLTMMMIATRPAKIPVMISLVMVDFLKRMELNRRHLRPVIPHCVGDATQKWSSIIAREFPSAWRLCYFVPSILAVLRS